MVLRRRTRLDDGGRVHDRYRPDSPVAALSGRSLERAAGRFHAHARAAAHRHSERAAAGVHGTLAASEPDERAGMGGRGRCGDDLRPAVVTGNPQGAALGQARVVRRRRFPSRRHRVAAQVRAAGEDGIRGVPRRPGASITRWSSAGRTRRSGNAGVRSSPQLVLDQREVWRLLGPIGGWHDEAKLPPDAHHREVARIRIRRG